MTELEVVHDAAVLIDDGRVAAIGSYKDLRQQGGEVVEVNGVLLSALIARVR